MSSSQRSRTGSAGISDDLAGFSKARKLNDGKFAPSSVKTGKRAARACDRCRHSKLRCQPSDNQLGDPRCAHCAKLDRVCEYTNTSAPHSNDTPTGLAGTSRAPIQDNDRLSKLEQSVVQLLNIMGQNADALRGVQTLGSNSLHQPEGATRQSQDIQFNPDYLLQNHNQGIPLETLDISPYQTSLPGNEELPKWQPHRQIGLPTPNSSVHLLPFSESSNEMSSMQHEQLPFGSQSSYAPQRQATIGFSLSPTGISEGGTALKITTNQSEPIASADETMGPTTARPLPKYATSSRMAAFTDPSSHEAPFRSLTYNPDAYRNVEMAEETPGDDGQTDKSFTGNGVIGDGGKTPKRGRGDPIDRGIFSEKDARALFSFYHDEISYFLPICQEPMTFDSIRHRSSFLLSAILAVAAKYCCVTTVRTASQGPSLGNMMVGNGNLDRHGVDPVPEAAWLKIRALAMSSYFQALISKVHCLEDVQATLLLCAWGLQDRGASPDPWLLTGSAYRLSRRLGLHQAAVALASGSAEPTAKLVASLKTYLGLYALDRFFTVGFGRPETEGFDAATTDTTFLLQFLQGDSPATTRVGLFCSAGAASCIAAYVELANIARRYTYFVNIILKSSPSNCLNEMSEIGAALDTFSSRWLWTRSPLKAKLGLSLRPVKMLYNHIRLCLHSVPLKPTTHPGSELFLRRTQLQGSANATFLSACLKKAEDSATSIIQGFVDDLRDDSDCVFSCSYDYAYMILAHSAAVLLSLSTIRISGIDDHDTASVDSTITPVRKDGGVDRTTAMRYCGMTITAMVESNQSANFFPCDMASNLTLIAKETGMLVSDWISQPIIDAIDARAAESELGSRSLPPPDDNPFPSNMDFSMFPDIDMFLQPSFFDDANLFSSTFQI